MRRPAITVPATDHEYEDGGDCFTTTCEEHTEAIEVKKMHDDTIMLTQAEPECPERPFDYVCVSPKQVAALIAALQKMSDSQ